MRLIENRQNDIIVPSAGTDEEFDNSQASMEDLKTQLDKLLKEYKEPINHKRSVIVIQGKKSILLKFHSNLKYQVIETDGFYFKSEKILFTRSGNIG